MKYAPLVIAAMGVLAWLFVARAGRYSAANAAGVLAGMDAEPTAAVNFQLEQLYAIGLAALRDNQFSQAAYALALAAQRGHPRAQLHYGVLCEHGIGVPVDMERARGLYQQAAAAGDVDAYFRLQVLDEIKARGD